MSKVIAIASDKAMEHWSGLKVREFKGSNSHYYTILTEFYILKSVKYVPCKMFNMKMIAQGTEAVSQRCSVLRVAWKLKVRGSSPVASYMQR